jgi:hypothetical protein
MEEHAEALAVAVDRVLAGWVERSVARIMVAYQGSVPADVRAGAADAGRAARAEVGVELRELLARDIDDQRTNPLAVLRGAVRFPTAVLRAAGVPPVVRDDFAERAFPDDIYDLSPATWRDVDESLHEPGIVWGAWKAGEHLRRRRPKDEA